MEHKWQRHLGYLGPADEERALLGLDTGDVIMALQAAAAHTSRISIHRISKVPSATEIKAMATGIDQPLLGLNRGSSQARSRRTVCITAAASALETPKPIAMIDYA